MTENIKERLIVALDVATAREARELFAPLRDEVGMFKIGMQLFTAAGPGLVREIVKAGGRVFLDLKYHDIPNTVAGASREAARLGVSIFNVHAAGGREMMLSAARAVKEVCEREGLKRPAIIAVTALTSMDNAALEEVCVTLSPQEYVPRMARLAAECGLDGVVASPKEVALVREAVGPRKFLIVTPGVRPAGFAHGDQKRVLTPSEAFAAGADYLVLGRAILASADPASAAGQIIEEIERGSALKL